MVKETLKHTRNDVAFVYIFLIYLATVNGLASLGEYFLGLDEVFAHIMVIILFLLGGGYYLAWNDREYKRKAELERKEWDDRKKERENGFETEWENDKKKMVERIGNWTKEV